MKNLAHVKIVIRIILGLNITHSLKGAIKIVEHLTKIKPYWVQLLLGFLYTAIKSDLPTI